MGIIIWFICVLLIAGCLLAVARAVLALPFFGELAPFANVVYALVVLLVVLAVINAFYSGPAGSLWGAFGPPLHLRTN